MGPQLTTVVLMRTQICQWKLRGRTANTKTLHAECFVNTCRHTEITRVFNHKNAAHLTFQGLILTTRLTWSRLFDKTTTRVFHLVVVFNPAKRCVTHSNACGELDRVCDKKTQSGKHIHSFIYIYSLTYYSQYKLFNVNLQRSVCVCVLVVTKHDSSVWYDLN